MISSCSCILYDINLGATSTTILSTWGVTIPIDLVSSATDSIRRCIVLFKLVPILTSDPKSEFLCQSSQHCQRTYRPPESPRTPGISPTPSQPCITRTTQNQVLSPSTSRTSCTSNELNDLVAVILLKLSGTFSLNVTCEQCCGDVVTGAGRYAGQQGCE